MAGRVIGEGHDHVRNIVPYSQDDCPGLFQILVAALFGQEPRKYPPCGEPVHCRVSEDGPPQFFRGFGAGRRGGRKGDEGGIAVGPGGKTGSFARHIQKPFTAVGVGREGLFVGTDRVTEHDDPFSRLDPHINLEE